MFDTVKLNSVDTFFEELQSLIGSAIWSLKQPVAYFILEIHDQYFCSLKFSDSH